MGNSPLHQLLDPSPIQKAELFSSLLERELEIIVAHSGIMQLRRGCRLFSIGEQAERFYMLLEGSIRVFRPLPDGADDEMARFTAGDTIGDFDFARRAAYDACAEAMEDSVLVMFPGYGMTMSEFAQEEPHTVSRILLGSLIMLTARIKSTQKIIVKNMSWVQELQRRAYEDPGTGLWKQSFLTDELNQLLEAPTALIMLKPDRFKILVDSRGHGAGDEAMVRIAMVLKNITRRIGRGWPLRFKSNEVGLLINKSGAFPAETIARELSEAISGLEPMSGGGDIPAFQFSGTISYAVWPEDDPSWDSLFQGNYTSLLEAWRAGGGTIAHYRRPELK